MHEPCKTLQVIFNRVWSVCEGYSVCVCVWSVWGYSVCVCGVCVRGIVCVWSVCEEYSVCVECV